MKGKNNKLVWVMIMIVVYQYAADKYVAEGGVTCNQLQGGLMPCLGFLQGRTLVPQCCNGVRSMAAAARTPLDRQSACRCLQSAIKNFQGINLGNVAALPARCGVNIPFKISPNTDCARIG